MKSIRFRQGTRKWKKKGHKSLEWFIKQYGEVGKKLYERGR